MLGALAPEVIPSLETAKAMGPSEGGRLSGPLRAGGPGAERAGLRGGGEPHSAHSRMYQTATF